MGRLAALLVSISLLPVSPASAQDEKTDAPPVRRVLITGATIHPGDGPARRADVLIEKGKIVAVGTDLDARGAERVDAAGRILIPGLVDARSGLCVTSSDRAAGRPSYLVRDAVDPWDRAIVDALAGGVTTALVAPGHAATWGGRCAVISLASPARHVRVDPGVLATIGVTRGRSKPTAASLRGEWGNVVSFLGKARAAQEAGKKYRAARSKWLKAHAAWKKTAEEAKKKGEDAPKEPAEPKRPRPDADADALAALVAGRAPLRVETHGTANLRAALAAARQGGVHLVLDGCTGLADLAAEIPETVPAVVAVRPRGGPPEAKPSAADAVALVKAGVPTAIASFGRSGRLLDLAALAVRAGLTREQALRCVTADAARAVGLAGRVGRIAKGLEADLVCLDGDPFRSGTAVLWVMNDGELVHGRRP
jgi:imidazolonepropionase-like amidohydrolase